MNLPIDGPNERSSSTRLRKMRVARKALQFVAPTRQLPKAATPSGVGKWERLRAARATDTALTLSHMRARGRAASAQGATVDVGSVQDAFHLQGDMTLNTHQAWEARMALRTDARVVSMLQLWWEVVYRSCIDGPPAGRANGELFVPKLRKLSYVEVQVCDCSCTTSA
jgi:hypothetical protein